MEQTCITASLRKSRRGYFIRSLFRLSNWGLYSLGVLCILVASKAKVSASVAYTDISPDRSIILNTNNSNLSPLDLDNDGTIDFKFSYSANGGSWGLFIFSQGDNEVLAKNQQNSNTINYTYPAITGNIISSAAPSNALWKAGLPQGVILADNQSLNFAIGYDRIIGVRIKKGSNFLYGWIRVNLSSTSPYQFDIKDYALNDQNDQSVGAVPGNNYLTSTTLGNFDIIVNEITTSQPATIAPTITEVYDETRFQDENFTYQYAIRKTSSQGNTNSFTGFLQVIPSLGTPLKLNKLKFVVTKASGNTSTTTVNWIDDNNTIVSANQDLASSIESGKAYYLRVSNLQFNDVITVIDDVTVISCLTGSEGSISMQIRSAEANIATGIPGNVVFESWKLAGENVKIDVSGNPFLYLKNTIYKGVESGLGITKSVNLSNWTGTSLVPYIVKNDGVLVEPACPSVGSDRRVFTYIIKKETNDRQVLRNILLSFNLNAIGGHNPYADNMSYLPTNEMSLKYYNKDGVVEIIGINSITVTKEPRKLSETVLTTTTGEDYDFSKLELQLPYNLKDFAEYYELVVNEYTRCPPKEFGAKKKTGWALVEKHELDCGKIFDARGEYYPSVGENGWADGFSINGNYEDKPVRLSGPRTKDVNGNGIIEPNLTEYKTLPQIYNFRFTPNGGENLDISGFSVNTSSARLFVVLKCDQGLNYTAFDQTTTLSGAYHALNPSNLALFNHLYFSDIKDPNNVSKQWHPINSNGQLAPSHYFFTDNTLYTSGNYGKKFVFEFKVSDLMNTSLQKFLHQEARMNFTLETECPTSGFPRYTIEYYLLPSLECTGCVLPINTIQNGVQVDCPGCFYPGGAGNYLTLERQTFGYPDDNKNRFADSEQPLTLAAVRAKNSDNDFENDIRTDLAFQNDIVRIAGSYYLTDGDQQCVSSIGPNTNSGPAPFNSLKYSYLLMNFPGGSNFTPLAQNNRDLTVSINYSGNIARYIIPAGSLSSVLHINTSGDNSDYLFDFSLSTLQQFHDNTSAPAPTKFNSLTTIDFELYTTVTGNPVAGDPYLELIVKGRPYFSSTAQTVITESPQLLCGSTGFSNTAQVYLDNNAFLCEDFGTQFNLIGIQASLTNTGENGTGYDAGRLCRQGRVIQQLIYLGKNANVFGKDYFKNEVRVLPHPTNMILPIPLGYSFDGKYRFYGGGNCVKGDLTSKSVAMNSDGNQMSYPLPLGADMNSYINNPSNWFNNIAPYTTADGFKVYNIRLNQALLLTDLNESTYSQLLNNGDIVSSDEGYYWKIPYTVRPLCNSETSDHAFSPANANDGFAIGMNRNVKDYGRLGAGPQTTKMVFDYLWEVAAGFKFAAPNSVQSPLYLRNPNNGSSQVSAFAKEYSADMSLMMDATCGVTGQGFCPDYPSGWEYSYVVFEPCSSLDGYPTLVMDDGVTELENYLINGRKVYRLGEFGFDPACPKFQINLKIKGAKGKGSILSCINGSAFQVPMKFLGACSKDPSSLDASSWCYQQNVSFSIVTATSNWTDEITSANLECSKQHIVHTIRSSGSAAIDGIKYNITLAAGLELDQDPSKIILTYGSTTLAPSSYQITKVANIYTLAINDQALNPPFISDAVGSVAHVNSLKLEYDVKAIDCSNISNANGIVIKVNGSDVCNNSAFASLNRTVATFIVACSNLCNPITADFSASPRTVCAGTPIQFTDLSTGNVTSWNWDFGGEGTSTQKNPSFIFYNAGTYSVTLTASNATSSDGETKLSYIVVNPNPAISITVDDPAIPGTLDCSILCSGENIKLIATPGFTSYQWKKDVTVLSGTSNTITLVNTNPDPAGWYYSTVTNVYGCSSTASVRVITHPVMNGTPEICEGETPSFSMDLAGASCSPPVQYLPSGNTYFDANGNKFQNYMGYVFPPACTLSVGPFPVKIKPVPMTPVITPEFTLVDPRLPVNVPLTATVESGVDFAWSNGSTSLSFTATNPGTYSVTSVKNGCSATGSASIIVPTVYGSQYCLSNNSVMLGASYNISQGDEKFVWKDGNGNVLTSTDPTGRTIVVSQAGTYTVSINTMYGVLTETMTVVMPGAASNVKVYDVDFSKAWSCTMPTYKSDLSCITTPFTSVNKMMGNYTVTSSDAGYWNFNLWNGSGFVGTIGNPTDRNYFLADGKVTAKTERVWYENVDVVAGKTYSLRALVNNVIMQNGQIPYVSLRIGGEGGRVIKQQKVFQYQPKWIELQGTWKATATEQVEIAVLLDGGGVLGRDIAIDNIYFEEIVCEPTNYGRQCLAKVFVGPDKFVSCTSNEIQIGANFYTSGLLYSWVGSDGFTSSDPNPLVSPTVTTTYKLTVTDPSNGNCQAIDNVTVYINNNTDAVVAKALADYTCITAGGPAKLNALGSGGHSPYTYSWTSSVGSYTSTLQSPTVNPTAKTTYNLKVKDAWGCIGKDTITIKMGQSPAAPTVSSILCIGETGSVTVSVTGQGVYGGLVQAPFSRIYTGVPYPGGLTVVGLVSNVNSDIIAHAVDANGCTTTIIIPGVVHPPITNLSLTASPSILCQGASTQLDVAVTGGASPFTYNWSVSGGSFGSTIKNPISSPTSNTLYDLSVTDQYGCTNSGQIQVTVNPAPAIPTVTTSTSSACEGTNITLSTSATGVTYKWKKDGVAIAGATNSSYVASAWANYTLEVSNGTCTATSSAINPFVLSRFSLPQNACHGDAIYLDGTASTNETGYWIEIYETTCTTCTGVVGGTYYNSQWTYQPVGIINLSSFYNFGAGKIYRAKLAVSSGGCAWSENVQYITVAPKAVSSFTLNPSICSNQAVIMDGSASTNEVNHFIEIYKTSCLTCVDVAGPYYSSWFTGQAGSIDLRTLYTFSPGIYKVKLAVTNAGCVWNQSDMYTTITGACKEGMLDENIDSGVSIYSNPAKDYFNVDIYSLSDKATIQLTNLEGKLIKEIVTESLSTTINIEDVNEGVYIVTVIRDKEVVRKKLEVLK